MSQVNHSLRQVKSEHVFKFRNGSQFWIQFLGVTLDLVGFDEHWDFDIFELVRLFDLLHQTELVFHELGFVVALGDAQLRTLVDVFIFEDVHDAVALHGGIVVLGPADVGVVRHRW